jgi:ACS family glucarate transporter-like MFS transporter
MPGVALLIARFGWRTSFVILGGVGIAWAAAWYAWFRDDPAEHPGISPDERAYILGHRQQADGDAIPGLTAGVVVRSADMWLLMGQYFASNFTFFFFLTWLLPHLSDRYGLSTTAAGWYAMLPFLAGMLGNWIGGGLVDALYRRGHRTASRRFPAMIGFVLASLGLVASLRVEDPAVAIACFSLAILGSDMTVSPSWSVCVDIGRRHAGAVSGTMNMAGNLGAFLTALAFPYLHAWTGSTEPFFLVGAGLNVLALLAWRLIRADRPLGVS